MTDFIDLLLQGRQPTTSQFTAPMNRIMPGEVAGIPTGGQAAPIGTTPSFASNLDSFLSNPSGIFLMNLLAQEGRSLTPGPSPLGAIGRAGLGTAQQLNQNRLLEERTRINEMQKRLMEAQIGAIPSTVALNEARAAAEGRIDPVDLNKTVNELADDVRTESKDFALQTAAYGRIQASATDPSAAGDLALIFNYMKVLDPGSTVREGEFANAESSGSVDDRIWGLYNKVLRGTRLSDPQRADFINRSARLYNSAVQDQQRRNDRFRQRGLNAKLPEAFIDPLLPAAELVDIPGMSNTPPVSPIPQSAIAEGVTSEVWNAMTDEERARFD
jgi:hypothetical protein